MKKCLAFLLSLLLLVSFSVMSSAEEFVAPTIIQAKGIEDFVGEWQMYCIQAPDDIFFTYEDLKNIGEVGNNPAMVISADEVKLSVNDTYQTAHFEFLPEDGSLKVMPDQAVENPHDVDADYFFLCDNGMLVCPAFYNEDMNAYIYFIRYELLQQ